MKTAVNLYACLVAQQIWGDSDSLALAQSLGINDSLKSLSSVTDPPKVSSLTVPNTDKASVLHEASFNVFGSTLNLPVFLTFCDRQVLERQSMLFMANDQN